MPPSNAWKSYRQIATQTASPGNLILMLYEGALHSLARALQGFELADPAEANMTIHNNVFRAQEIIRELDFALDMHRGGECAETLRNLYRYFDERLHESNVSKSREGVNEVITHVTVLRDAWATMLSRGETEQTQEPMHGLELAFA